MNGLAGKVALVTGASRGIGLGVAKCLLRSGAQVVIAARNAETLDAAAESLADLGDVATAVTDVADPASVASAVQTTVDRFGSLDVLVASHGVLNHGTRMLEFDKAAWDETIAVNLTGVFLCGQAAARQMVEQGNGGRIVNISSLTAFASVPNEIAYEASKAGVEGVTRAMAVELAAYEITVNSVAPGWVRTEMVADMLDATGTRPCNALGRAAEPEEIGNAVTWLADPASSYMTGATIVIDGGQRIILTADPPDHEQLRTPTGS